ncbi:coiled-coil domain-containing protein 57 isoform X4 [Nannospalax galili]|nr:coiled-coil domain-containing protein 57 isoform X4 [Nannospalax galili]XP_008826376.1 coiled-coil domain-containing protein 57 isoform X4 [Nannospalax galili]XP_029416858.1 coiled-coil domain-containing protein 57 isoform X4 [Nannospalax galili]XP_029416861.1 coiled-coil domain-containing protein 57 isoform X4 [Nannospalax galili]XP_029416868.1 coiled-coil domain-containing protein 57 isoform X4 [Nannospalax galili]XP_029416871.1 coiled-coil domain-containing protein 57 isoform X4 [Nannosp
MLPLCSKQALSELLARKEEEWRALQAHRAQLQEAALQDTQNRLEEVRGKLRRLQEDFVYNLQVLEERDQELERYDAEFAQAGRREEARQAETSELKIEVAKLKQALTREVRRAEELQQQQQLRVQEHRLELERIRSDKNSELDHQREQYENLKWKLERKLEELDGELALQKQELLQEFESEMQRREHEFQLKADDMGNMVLSHELKVKLLNKELQALREAGMQAAESLQKAERKHTELEKKLQDTAWELRDMEAVKGAQIKDLEDKLCSVQLSRKKEEEIFRRKHEELDRLAREKDTMLTVVKEAHTEQLRALEARVLELQAHCETLEAQLRRAEWTRADTVKEKNVLIDNLREEIAALKADWDAQITQMSKEVVSKDLHVQTLQEEEVKLKAQVARLQQDIDRYKQQLSLAVEREQSLERDQVQLNLDWQRRCDDIERDQIQRSEALIQGLTKARTQVAAKLQETERALNEQVVLLKAVSLERDQAVEMLRARGLLPGQETQIPPQQHEGELNKDFPSSEIRRLQEQNTGLRNAVSQMRREMETLSAPLPPVQTGGCSNANPEPKAGGDAVPPDCVLALEAEMQNLKHKLEALEEQLEGVAEPAKAASATADLHRGAQSSAESAALGMEARALHVPGGTALTGQASTALALRKLGDRVHLLNLLVTQLKKKVQQKPLELNTIHHELPQEVDWVHLEVLELQKQVAELSKHLQIAWPQEGEASDRKQLQREGLTNRSPMGTEDQVAFPGCPQQGAQAPQTMSLPRLQRKLKEAARKILSLHLEKEQLLEMGNRLRAELGHPKGRLDPHEVPEGTLDQGPPLGLLQPHSKAQDPKHKRKYVSEYAGMSQACSAQVVSKHSTPQDYKAAVTSEPAQRQHKIPTGTLKSVRQKEDKSLKRPQSQEVPEESDPHTHRSSSLASSSLQDTWKLLDLGSSLSGLPSQDDSAAGGHQALGDKGRAQGQLQEEEAKPARGLASELQELVLRGQRKAPVELTHIPLAHYHSSLAPELAPCLLPIRSRLLFQFPAVLSMALLMNTNQSLTRVL